MSSASILGPPRNGRAVRKPEEVLAEIRIQEKNDSIENIVSGSKSANDSTLDGGLTKGPIPDGLSEDLFRFQDLSLDSDGNIVLHKLEVPEGTWDALTLKLDFYSSGETGSHETLTEISNGKGRILYGAYTPFDVQVPNNTRMIPLKARYWFMRAGYEIENGRAWCTDKSVAGLLRTVCQKDLCDGGFYHSETLSLHLDHAGPMVIIETQGWPKDHPLYVKTKRSLPPSNMYLCADKLKIGALSYALFGDPDDDRIEKVMAWASANPQNSLRFQIKTDSLFPCSVGFYLDTSIIYITGDTTSHRRTRGLIAKPSDFHAWVKQ